MDYHPIIDKYYPAGTLCRGIFMQHSRQVANLALAIATRKALPLQHDIIDAAAMLHDIGIFLTDAPSIGCTGTEPYIRHGLLGAELLRKENAPEIFARVAERHTGAGITVNDIITQNLPIPCKDYCPESLLEKLICYADKFYSKSGNMEEKTLEKVRQSMARISPETLERFEKLHQLFN